MKQENENIYSRYIKHVKTNTETYKQLSEEGKKKFHDQFLDDVKRTARRLDKANRRVEDLKARKEIIDNEKYKSDWQIILGLSITTAFTAAGLIAGSALDNALDSGAIATSIGTFSSAVVGCGIGTKLTGKSFRSRLIQKQIKEANKDVKDAEVELEAHAMLVEKITGNNVWYEDDLTNN